MKYRHVVDKPSYSDFASGKVLYGLPGQVATPLRLVDELFQSGLEVLHDAGLSGPVTVYDPCCGTAYHLAALAYLHWPTLSQIFASDVNADVVAIAQRNLSLLSLDGLDQRIRALQQLYESFGKAPHRDALSAAQRLRTILEPNVSHEIKALAFDADALTRASWIGSIPQNEVTMVLSDLPYGRGSNWESGWFDAALDLTESQIVARVLTELLPILHPKAVICLLTSKTVKISHSDFQPVRHFRAGTRLAALLQLVH